MTKSVLQLARDAPAAGEMALPSHAGRFSRRGCAQPPLFAVLVLRQFLRTDYPGIVALVAEVSRPRSLWEWLSRSVISYAPNRSSVISLTLTGTPSLTEQIAAIVVLMAR